MYSRIEQGGMNRLLSLKNKDPIEEGHGKEFVACTWFQGGEVLEGYWFIYSATPYAPLAALKLPGALGTKLLLTLPLTPTPFPSTELLKLGALTAGEEGMGMDPVVPAVVKELAEELIEGTVD
jgi:hypothetical protein